MPQETYKVFPIQTEDKLRTITVTELNKVIFDINAALQQVALAIGAIQGKDAKVPTFDNDVDFDGHDLTNIGSITTSARKRVSDPVKTTFTMPAPGAAPATATVLRDDLADNVFPAITKSLNALSVQLTRILAVVKV